MQGKLAGAQAGFSLAELTVVIVILAVIGGVAVGRLTHLQEEARKAVMEGAGGSLRTALELLYAKAYVQGVHQQPSATLLVDSRLVRLRYGYPVAEDLEKIAELAGFVIIYDQTQTSSPMPDQSQPVNGTPGAGQGSGSQAGPGAPPQQGPPQGGTESAAKAYIRHKDAKFPEACQLTYMESSGPGGGALLTAELSDCR